MSPSPVPETFSIDLIRDSRGAIGVLEESLIGFPIRRVYYLVELQAESQRGAHAHRDLEQVMIALSGSFAISLSDGKQWQETFMMSSPRIGLRVPPGYWRELGDFSAGAVCLVLASLPYDENDYIRDFSEFVHWKAGS